MENSTFRAYPTSCRRYSFAPTPGSGVPPPTTVRFVCLFYVRVHHYQHQQRKQLQLRRFPQVPTAWRSNPKATLASTLPPLIRHTRQPPSSLDGGSSSSSSIIIVIAIIAIFFPHRQLSRRHISLTARKKEGFFVPFRFAKPPGFHSKKSTHQHPRTYTLSYLRPLQEKGTKLYPLSTRKWQS